MANEHYYNSLEFDKRLKVIKTPLANLPANKTIRTTGIGSIVELVDGSEEGGRTWEYKNNDFNIVDGENYLVDTENGIINGTLPLLPNDKQVVIIKDAKNTFGVNSLNILCANTSTYTIANITEDFEVDVSISYLVLVYDQLTNNWSV